MEIEEIVKSIIERLEDYNDDISVIWPTSNRSKITKDKFIVGLVKAYEDGIQFHEAFSYSDTSGFSKAINKIIHIKNKPKRIYWKQYFISLLDLKLCPNCKKIKELDNFSDDKAQKDGKSCWCKDCNNFRMKENRKETKIFILDKYFSLDCEICGYDTNLSVLELHHVKDLPKPEWAINKKPGDYLFGCSTETAEKRVKEEIDNLIVLCANCHREHHAIGNKDQQKGLKSILGDKYKCELCDERERLHLHHNNSEEKEVSFYAFNGLSKEKILNDGILEKEMKKDVSILCANHHREIHNPTGDYYEKPKQQTE